MCMICLTYHNYYISLKLKSSGLLPGIHMGITFSMEVWRSSCIALWTGYIALSGKENALWMLYVTHTICITSPMQQTIWVKSNLLKGLSIAIHNISDWEFIIVLSSVFLGLWGGDRSRTTEQGAARGTRRAVNACQQREPSQRHRV